MKDELREKIISTITSAGFYFIDLKTRRAGNKTFIEILADTDKGITVGECSSISKLLAKVLDDENYNNDYILDVSSPGIGYPLREDWQFNKNIGRTIEVQYRSNDGNIKISGKLNTIGEEIISLEDESGKITDLNRSEIILAKVKI